MPALADVMVVGPFGWLLYCEGVRVDGRPRSFGPSWFSLTMTLKKQFNKTWKINVCM